MIKEIVIVIIIIFIIDMLQVIVTTAYKLYQQQKLYSQAVKMANKKGKKLIVIGDPIAGFTNKLYAPYDCGDICIDMNGCDCENNAIIYKNKLEDILHKFESDKYVVFESHTLEYVNDIDYVISHINRISGGDIYAFHMHNYSLIGKLGDWFYRYVLGSDSTFVITEYPPYQTNYKYYKN
jgi:hypothetical protein